MSTFIENLTPKEWESFCAIMLRHHYTQKNFWEVPDKDQGDLGLEFYTVDGTLFQCYYPDKNIDMATYKKRMQKKINDDLKKLKTYESEILELLDDIVIDQWILIVPESKSKELLKYCNKKKKEVIEKNIAFVDAENFQVRIETADSFPQGKLFAQQIYSKAIDIPLMEVTDKDKAIWQKSNSKFSENIERKSNSLVGPKSAPFQDKVVTKYIQIEKFLDQLREDHPDLHGLIEDSARAQLENMQEESVLKNELNTEFVNSIVKSNAGAFSKHSNFFSDSNMQSLSFGYLSKWLAECYMDFKNG